MNAIWSVIVVDFMLLRCVVVTEPKSLEDRIWISEEMVVERKDLVSDSVKTDVVDVVWRYDSLITTDDDGEIIFSDDELVSKFEEDSSWTAAVDDINDDETVLNWWILLVEVEIIGSIDNVVDINFDVGSRDDDGDD